MSQCSSSSTVCGSILVRGYSANCSDIDTHLLGFNDMGADTYSIVRVVALLLPQIPERITITGMAATCIISRRSFGRSRCSGPDTPIPACRSMRRATLRGSRGKELLCHWPCVGQRWKREETLRGATGARKEPSSFGLTLVCCLASTRLLLTFTLGHHRHMKHRLFLLSYTCPYISSIPPDYHHHLHYNYSFTLSEAAPKILATLDIESILP